MNELLSEESDVCGNVSCGDRPTECPVRCKTVQCAGGDIVLGIGEVDVARNGMYRQPIRFGYMWHLKSQTADGMGKRINRGEYHRVRIGIITEVG